MLKYLHKEQRMTLALEGHPDRENTLTEAYIAGFVGRIGLTPLQSEARVRRTEETLPGYDGARRLDEEGDEYGRLIRMAIELGFALDAFTEPPGNFQRHEPRFVTH
jgi:hypothetical protein